MSIRILFVFSAIAAIIKEGQANTESVFSVLRIFSVGHNRFRLNSDEFGLARQIDLGGVS